MTEFKSYSQAGQDLLAFEMLVKPEGLLSGRFVDIGACHPIEISNTYALEQLGWSGILIDNDPGAVKLCREHRRGTVVEGDATAVDWSEILLPWLRETVDYVSVDVDSASEAALTQFVIGRTRFRDRLGVRLMTVETDAYRFGNGPRDAMRYILQDCHGLDLFCADVCSADGMPYEDWYCAPELSARADRFRCSGKKWTEIFPP